MLHGRRVFRSNQLNWAGLTKANCGRAFAVSIGLALAGALGIVWVARLLDGASGFGGVLIGVLLLGAMAAAAAGAWLPWWALATKGRRGVELNDEGLVERYWFGRPRVTLWDDIESVVLEPTAVAVNIRGGEVLRIGPEIACWVSLGRALADRIGGAEAPAGDLAEVSPEQLAAWFGEPFDGLVRSPATANGAIYGVFNWVVAADANYLHVKAVVGRKRLEWGDVHAVVPGLNECWHVSTTSGDYYLDASTAGGWRVLQVLRQALAAREGGSLLPTSGDIPEGALSRLSGANEADAERGISLASP